MINLQNFPITGLLGSIVLDRFFCKYLCPLGAFPGMIYRGRVVQDKEG